MTRCWRPNWQRCREEDIDLDLLGFDDDEIDRLLAGTDDETEPTR